MYRRPRTLRRQIQQRNGAFELTPSLSPDGERVAYRWQREGASGIFIKRIDGGLTTRLDLDDSVKFASATRPAWSPRGDLIAFLNADTKLSDIETELFQEIAYPRN